LTLTLALNPLPNLNLHLALSLLYSARNLSLPTPTHFAIAAASWPEIDVRTAARSAARAAHPQSTPAPLRSPGTPPPRASEPPLSLSPCEPRDARAECGSRRRSEAEGRTRSAR